MKDIGIYLQIINCGDSICVSISVMVQGSIVWKQLKKFSEDTSFAVIDGTCKLFLEEAQGVMKVLLEIV